MSSLSVKAQNLRLYYLGGPRLKITNRKFEFSISLSRSNLNVITLGFLLAILSAIIYKEPEKIELFRQISKAVPVIAVSLDLGLESDITTSYHDI